MKLKANTIIRDFPPKLKELAVKRAMELNGHTEQSAVNHTVAGAFTWSVTPEGGDFWSKVDSGREFNWEEAENFPEKWAILRTEKNYKEIEEWYFKNVKEYSSFPHNPNHPYLHFPIRGCGSSNKVNERYIEISIEQFRKHVSKKTSVESVVDKWAVKVPRTGEPSIVKFFIEVNKTHKPNFTEGFYYHFPAYNGQTNASNILEPGYREISLGEFKRITGVKEELSASKVTNKWGFVPGDKITNGAQEAVYLRDEGYDGWCTLSNGREWSMSSSSWRKIADFKPEKPEGIQVGSRVKAICGGHHRSSSLMETGETGIVSRLEEDAIYLISDLDGKEKCRKPGFLKEILHSATEVCKKIEETSLGVLPGTSASIPTRELGIDWERLRSVKTSAEKPEPGYSSYTWEIPTSALWGQNRRVGENRGLWQQLQEEATRYFYPTKAAPYDKWGASTSLIEPLPEAIIIKRKTKKKCLNRGII